jgi:AcrR family transcriptional regulator
MNHREQRRAAERKRQQAEIFAVALKAFAEAGYEGASMNAIAAESGYSVGHIYNVIGNKAALFNAVMLDGAGQFIAMITAAEKAHPGDPVGAIEETIDTVLEFFDQHREFFEVYLRHAAALRANVARVFSPALVQLKKKMDSRIKRLFQQAADKGLTADLPASDMAVAFSELVNGFIGTWAEAGYRGHVSRKSKVIKHLLWKGVGARVSASH